MAKEGAILLRLLIINCVSLKFVPIPQIVPSHSIDHQATDRAAAVVAVALPSSKQERASDAATTTLSSPLPSSLRAVVSTAAVVAASID